MEQPYESNRIIVAKNSLEIERLFLICSNIHSLKHTHTSFFYVILML